jgi:hypothetical protein
MQQSELITHLQKLFNNTNPSPTAAMILARASYTPENLEAARAEFQTWLDAMAQRTMMDISKRRATSLKDELRLKIQRRMSLLAQAIRNISGRKSLLLAYFGFQTQYTLIPANGEQSGNETGSAAENLEVNPSGPDQAEVNSEHPSGGSPVKWVRRVKDRDKSQHAQLKQWLEFLDKLPVSEEDQKTLDQVGWTAKRLQELADLVTEFNEALAKQRQAQVDFANQDRACHQRCKEVERWYRRYLLLVRGEINQNPTPANLNLREELALPNAS